MSTSLTPHSGTHAKREVRSDTGIGLETRAYPGRVLGLGRETTDAVGPTTLLTTRWPRNWFTSGPAQGYIIALVGLLNGRLWTYYQASGTHTLA